MDKFTQSILLVITGFLIEPIIYSAAYSYDVFYLYYIVACLFTYYAAKQLMKVRTRSLSTDIAIGSYATIILVNVVSACVALLLKQGYLSYSYALVLLEYLESFIVMTCLLLFLCFAQYCFIVKKMKGYKE